MWFQERRRGDEEVSVVVDIEAGASVVYLNPDLAI
jgi:hypothetical protein